MPEPTLHPDVHPLARYLTRLDADVYCLRNLPEEVVAVLFAYYSRSTGSLRDALASMMEQDLVAATVPAAQGLARASDQAARFHEKWVVGYGHSSVAEHAVAHVAIENVSILASKAVEDGRLASYTEKSTRYVWFDRSALAVPPELNAHPELKARYLAHTGELMDAYQAFSQPVLDTIRTQTPPAPGQAPRAWEAATKARACDICRYILPAATKTNLGLTLNGRSAEHLIRKLLSSPLEEVRRLGEAIKQEVRSVLPTLVKYADRNEHMAGRLDTVRSVLRGLNARPAAGPDVQSPIQAPLPADELVAVRCVSQPASPLASLAAAIVAEATGQPYGQLLEQASGWDARTQTGIVQAYLAGRSAHDAPGRALELLQYGFEITCDYGAWRDIQRHRICTQFVPVLGVSLGYHRPAMLDALGLAGRFDGLMARSAELHGQLSQAFGPEVAQYVVPLAYRVQTLFSWNLRSLWHFIALRSGRQGHLAYRRVAQGVWRELARVSPEIAGYVPVDMNDYETARSGQETVEPA